MKPGPTPPFSPVRELGDLLAISGHLGRRLTEAGRARADVIKTTVFLTDIADWQQLNAPYAAFFGTPYPARTALAVSALPMGAHVEIEAWAVRPARG